MMAHASSCPSTCSIRAVGTAISEVSANLCTGLLLGQPRHAKTDDHPHHQHTQQDAHHPDLHGHWWMQSDHVQAQHSGQRGYTVLLSAYGTHRDSHGVWRPVVELPALQGLALRSEEAGPQDHAVFLLVGDHEPYLHHARKHLAVLAQPDGALHQVSYRCW